MITALLQIWNRLGWQLKLVVALIALGLILGVSGLIYYSCQTNALKDELRREKEARSQEHQERIEEAKEETNQAANLSNQAMENFNKAVNRDSSTYDGSEAENKFCQRFKCDSSCFEWRKKNGVECD